MRPRLFTLSDVERAARLASTGVRVETAVEIVAAEGPLYYSEEEVRLMLQYALHTDNVEAAFEEALEAIRR